MAFVKEWRAIIVKEALGLLVFCAFRFPSTSPLKPIPNYPPALRKKSGSLKEKEGFFKFRNSKKFDKEALVRVRCRNMILTMEQNTPYKCLVLWTWNYINLTHITLGIYILGEYWSWKPRAILRICSPRHSSSQRGDCGGHSWSLEKYNFNTVCQALAYPHTSVLCVQTFD